MKHPRRALVTSLLLTCSSLAPISRAQTYPAAEAYVGFTVVNNEYGTDRHNSPGVQLSFVYNMTPFLGGLADFSAENHSTDIIWANGRRVEDNDYQLLFGPEFALRRSPRFTPFAHGLAGIAFRHYAVPTGNWICTGYSCYEDKFVVARETGFASGLGGGLDWRVWSIVSVRVAQFDWIRSNLSRDNVNYSPAEGQFPTLHGWQDNYRFSTGFTVRFGTREPQRLSRAHSTD